MARHRQATGARRIKDLQPHEDSVFINHILSKLTPPNQNDPATPTSMLTQVILMDRSKSAQALAAVYFGKMCNHKRAYQKGSQLYVQALDQLRHAIVDPKTAVSSETLASVLCLCIYENVALSEPLAWVRHYGGVSRLVELRGPDCQRNDLEMDIFRVCRFMIVSIRQYVVFAEGILTFTDTLAWHRTTAMLPRRPSLEVIEVEIKGLPAGCS